MSLARAEADLAQAKADVRRYEGLLDAARGRQTKLEHYIEMSRQYAGIGEEEDASDVALGRRRARSGVSGEAVNAVIGILRDHKMPLPTRELVRLLRERGIVLGGPPEREITNLSGYLSRASELRSDRVAGWRLAVWDDVDRTGEELPSPTAHAEQRERDVNAVYSAVAAGDIAGARALAAGITWTAPAQEPPAEPVPEPSQEPERDGSNSYGGYGGRAKPPERDERPTPQRSGYTQAGAADSPSRAPPVPTRSSSWDAPKGGGSDLDDEIPF